MKSPRLEFKTELSPEEVQLLSENATKLLETSPQAVPPIPLTAFIFDPNTPQKQTPTLLGDIYAEIQGSWLYIDTLWVDEKLRGQGFGIRLMQVVEQAAVERGINRAFLGTSSFQAPRFYQQLGYSLVGQMPASIPDNSLYLMTRQPLTPYQLPPESEIALHDQPDDALVEALGNKLQAYNEAQTGVLEQATLGGLFAYDDKETLIGGGISWHFGQWFGIRALWVDPSQSNQGIAAKIIKCLETAASEHTNLFGMSRTSHDQIAEWYEDAGYQNVAQIPDFPAEGRMMRVSIKSFV